MTRSANGFTLIEVIGAFVIFAVGVLMVMRVSTAATTQMRYAGISSALALHAAERLDSLDATLFGSLSAGTEVDTLLVSGLAYERAVTVTPLTALLIRFDAVLTPTEGVGPSYQATSYVSEVW